jgi:hypothetical protein
MKIPVIIEGMSLSLGILSTILPTGSLAKACLQNGLCFFLD